MKFPRILRRIPLVQHGFYLNRKEQAQVVVIGTWAISALLILKDLIPSFTEWMMAPVIDLTLFKLSPFMFLTYFMLSYVTYKQEKIIRGMVGMAQRNFLTSWVFLIIVVSGILFIADILFVVLNMDPVFQPLVAGWVEGRS